ncbi:MAG: hypothetical protein ACKO8Z_17015 [Prosthecobacter sp.]
MNSKHYLPHAACAVGLLLVLSTSIFAQQGYYQAPPRYAPPPPIGSNQQPFSEKREGPLGFIPKMGQKLGSWVRRAFYGEQSTHGGYSQPASQRGSAYGQNEVRQYANPTPSGAYHPLPNDPTSSSDTTAQAQTPRYSYPPHQSAAAKTMPPPSSSPNASKSQPTTAKIEEPQSKSKIGTSKSSTKATKPSSAPAQSIQSKEPEVAATTRSAALKTKEEPLANPSSSGNAGSFLKGKKTGKPGRVISPYPPYKELDITGLDSGSLALDPTTQKVFEVP